MHKPIISSVIALALMGCGGGESGGGGSTPVPVKYFTVSFFDLDNVETKTQTNCQIFGYNQAEDKKVVAYTSIPQNNYQIVIHDENGSFVRNYDNSTVADGLGSTFRFQQNEVPNNGYVSFFYVDGRDYFITTISKNLIPENFSIYANNKNSNSTCLITSSGTSSNPQISDYKSFIKTPDEDKLFFFSLNHFNQKHLNPTNKTGREVSVSSRTKIPLLLTAYERTTENPDVMLNIFGFTFKETNDLGTLQNEVDLKIIDQRDTPWYVPSDVELTSSLLYIDGKKYNAPYAYLWQSLDINKDSTYSYSNNINNEDYYLNLRGKDSIISQSSFWTFQHVARGTNEISSQLSADNILESFPSPQTPKLEPCDNNRNSQCVKISDQSKIDNTTLRVLIDSESITANNSPIFIRQTIYSPYSNSLPVMKFNDASLDKEIKDINSFHLSLIKSSSDSVINAFLYQHQDLYQHTVNSKTLDPALDNIPLIKNIAAQQDQQDLLKRQPYTWVWLEQGDN